MTERNEWQCCLSGGKDKYLNHLVSMERSGETIRGYRTVLNYLEEYFAIKYNRDVYLDEVTFGDLDDFICSMSTEKKWQINSVKKCHYVLSSFFGYCYRKELCPKDISKQMEPVKGEQKERVYLTTEEFERLINHLDHHIVKHIALTMFYSGIRISECLNLKIGDLDFKRSVFKIRKGKGKTFRLVPMHEKLKKILKSYLKDNNLRDFKVREGRVFATARSGTISAVYVNQKLKEASLRAGLPKGISAHVLRHSFASNLVNKNRSLVHVQKLLGHADLRTTGIYTHAKLDELAESVNIL